MCISEFRYQILMSCITNKTYFKINKAKPKVLTKIILQICQDFLNPFLWTIQRNKGNGCKIIEDGAENITNCESKIQMER